MDPQVIQVLKINLFISANISTSGKNPPSLRILNISSGSGITLYSKAFEAIKIFFNKIIEILILKACPKTGHAFLLYNQIKCVTYYNIGLTS